MTSKNGMLIASTRCIKTSEECVKGHCYINSINSIAWFTLVFLSPNDEVALLPSHREGVWNIHILLSHQRHQTIRQCGWLKAHRASKRRLRAELASCDDTTDHRPSDGDRYTAIIDDIETSEIIWEEPIYVNSFQMKTRYFCSSGNGGCSFRLTPFFHPLKRCCTIRSTSTGQQPNTKQNH